MGVRINADRIDTSQFAPQRPAPEPPVEETEETTAVRRAAETDEAEETRDAADAREVAEAEEVENDRATQQTPAPGGRTDVPPSPFDPSVPGGNLNIVA